MKEDMLILLLCVCVFVKGQEGPIVLTTQGRVAGSKAYDGDYLSFYGIHYAGSTSGANRYKAPTPAPTYPGVFSATESGVFCAQPTARGLVGEEDCLRLDIHTKNLTTPKPVVVWLNSEEFTTTKNRIMSFKSLVQRDIVVVSMNHRLSVFGFLCLGVPDAPGNAGLKDIIAGLKWIKENIAVFGGDPNNVLLFGHGSGAALADLVTLSPQSTGLVNKAIIQSGSALSPWAISYNPIEYARALGGALDYKGLSVKDLAKHLVNTDINVLESALRDFTFFNNTPLFAPCLENPNLNDTVLTEAPVNVFRSGNFSQIPVIYGYTNREGSLRAGEAAHGQWLNKMQENFTDFLPADISLNSQLNSTDIETRVRQFYFANKSVSMETIEDFLDYEGDTMVLVSVIRSANARAVKSKADVWLYEFAYKGTLNSDWAFPQIPLRGAPHGEVLKYLFEFDLKPSDKDVAEGLQNHFESFAKNGTPGSLNKVTWEKVNPPVTWCLIISGEEMPPNLVNFKEELYANPHSLTLAFWDDLYSSFYRVPTSVSSATKVWGMLALLLLSQFLLKVVY